MDEALFREAEKSYAAGDYRAAAKTFLAAAGRKAEGSGPAYHQAGNALMKLHREHDAVTVYGHALKDEAYDKAGAVLANLGRAHAAVGSYHEAVETYKRALEEPDYRTPYKALQGMAAALWQMERFEDAAKAYRKAALETGNPDPGKALNNLGQCFMKLGRPADAVEAYRAALGVDGYSGKGRATSNLGMAYAAAGEADEACRAFEKAVHLHGHALPPEASAVYGQCRAEVVADSPDRETVDGWSTGDMPAVGAVQGEERATGPEVPAEEPVAVPFGEGETDFFTLSEQEMKEKDRAARRAEKQQRRSARNPWAIVASVAGVIVALAVAVGALYYFGIGWPTQRQTVNGMMDAYAGGEGVEGYWVAVPQADIDKEMSKITPNFAGYEMDGVERTPMTSRVDLTVTPAKGAPLHYKVTLAREGVGWKVTGIENDWASTGGSP